MSKPEVKYLKDYTVSPFLVDEFHLNVKLNEDVTTVSSTAHYRRNLESEHLPLTLDGQEMDLKAVYLDGQHLSEDAYMLGTETLTLHDVPDAFELRIVTEIKPQENTSLEGLYKSSGNYCTQCEATGFRKITYYLDRPDVMTVFTTTLEADQAKYPVLLSNGNLINTETLDNGRHIATWHDPHKKPCYLFAMVAGDLEMVEDSFTTLSGRDVTLRIFAEAHNIDKCDHAMESLKKSMKWDEERYGLEYDLDIFMIVAVDDFNMGAMENKGLNIFNSKLVFAKPESATDKDYESIEAVIGHEYFHNWTGNRVTCRDWFQLTLKEGLTVYRDQEFTSDLMSRPVKRIEDVQLLRSYQFPEDAGPMSHPIQPSSYIEMNNFYTVTVYEKGAEVVRMYETLLGRDGFRRGMDLYFERHDGQAVTVDDFRMAMADANGVDLTQFRRWYEQAGTPKVKVVGTYDEQAQNYTLTVEQTNKDEPLHIPFAVGLLNSEGQDILPEGTQVIDIKEGTQSVTFENITESPVPSLLRGFSAPVELDFDYTAEQLAFLMANDSDEFNRWEAGQKLMAKEILAMVDDLQNGIRPQSSDVLLHALEATLTNDSLEPAFRALALSMPSIGYLCELTETVDIDNLVKAHKQMKHDIARFSMHALLTTYRAMEVESEEYSPCAKDSGQRALRNLCLNYMMTLDSIDALKFAWNQYHDSNNMTDVLAALKGYSHSHRQEREVLLEEFYNKWHKEPLVLDK